jgi:hypothetical protein
MPIVGSFAGASARAYGLGAGVAIGDFESIATITAGSAVSNIEFTSIPATFTHLQIRGITYNSSTSKDVFLQFNTDTGSNYSRHYLYGDGSSAGSGANTSDVNISVGYTSLTSNIFGVSVIDVLDYTNTNKYKTTRSLAGYDANGSGLVVLYSGNWRSTAAITSIKLYPGNGNFNQYSSFALYGVKA